MRELERRHIIVPVEWRAAPQGDGPGTLYGYAAKFNTESQDLGGFIETIAPGAFTKTLKEGARVLARYNHRDSHLLGTTEAGTLRLSVDKVGLAYEVDLPDTSSGRDIAVLAARGDVRYSSFAFFTIKDEWDFDVPTGQPAKRTLLEVQLSDVAPVNSPAYMDTSVAKRSLDERHAAMGQQEPITDPVEGREAPNDAETGEPHKHSTVPASVQRALAELNEAK